MTNAAVHWTGNSTRCTAHAHDAPQQAPRTQRASSTRSSSISWSGAWLFVLSTCSYLVDYFGLHGYLRWSLILLFMVLKAGLIVAVFMHMAWERLALAYAILLPPVLVLVFVAIMVFESDYTHLLRVMFFAPRRRYHCFASEGGRS